MPPTGADTILAVNAGSSSLKITLFDNDAALHRRSAATVERITLRGAAPDFDAALGRALEQIATQGPITASAAGHRIVHGGAEHAEPEAITPALLADLHRLEPIDPNHLPQALSLIDAMGRRYPNLRQYACFDTAFHRTMPRVSQQYPLPRSTWDAGVRRYGFHGLSCESIVSGVREIDAQAARGRMLIAHLGNGASVTAVHNLASVDTTMGFSPTGGLMMGTRSGDLDPTVLTYLARSGSCTLEELEHLVTAEAGLLGVSGVSSDMQDLLSRADSADARDAIALYCYTARKHIGAMAAALNGIDTMVFTGGIGEHASAIRAGICTGLEHLGVALDAEANAASRPVISRANAAVTVRVMKADEDLIIARHVRRLLA
jgi:acetate kinase